MPRFTEATHCSLSDLGHAAATLEELLKTAHDAGAEAHDQSTSRLTAYYQVTGLPAVAVLMHALSLDARGPARELARDLRIPIDAVHLRIKADIPRQEWRGSTLQEREAVLAEDQERMKRDAVHFRGDKFMCYRQTTQMSFHWTVEVEQAAQVQVVHAFNSIYMTDSTLTLYEVPPSIILSALLALYDEREHPLSATTPIHVLVLVFVHLMSGSTTATLGRNNKNWETLFGALGTAFKARLREWLVRSEGGLTRGGATTHHVAAWFREHSQGGSLPADLQLDISAALEWAKELFVPDGHPQLPLAINLRSLEKGSRFFPQDRRLGW